ncbi:MAG: VWA domain-containing protein [Holophagae bacterium]|jgi:VWFA-related protein
MRAPRLATIILFAGAALGSAQTTPLALNAHVQVLGSGADGTVVGAVIELAPEDRDRAGERVRVITTTFADGRIVDRQSGVVQLQPDGTAMLYREWDPGVYELHIGVSSLDGTASGIWIGEIEVGTSDTPFRAPEGAPVDAVALDLSPPREGAVQFLPPPNLGGIGAVQLEVEAPEHVASVEFFSGDDSLGRRNRPPWTVSIPLGAIMKRTQVRAVALDADGRYVGEDAIVLNNPSGQIGVEILLAPDSAVVAGKRPVKVAVSGGQDIQQVVLRADDEIIARWAACPCRTEVAVSRLQNAVILSAEAEDAKGTRGDAVLTLGAGGGFVGSVRVELVELPVVVLDTRDVPVIDLQAGNFEVAEDDQPVSLEGFGSTEDLPLSLAIAVDTSGSMIEDFPKVRAAVRGFADELLEKDDQAVLIDFSWDANVQVAWTDNIQALVGHLDRVRPEGGTSLHDAVVRSLEQFRGRRGRQALVLLTDGEDTTSRTGWEVAERFAHTMRIPVFSIGLGVGKLSFGSRRVLNALARETGGEAFYPKTVDELPAVYDRIAELLRSQYLLWYTSPSDKPPEAFRTIEVSVDRPDVEVKTIRGYYPGK